MSRPRSPCCCALAVLLLAAPAARAGELIDRAAQGLQADNIYVDPDADPKLSEADVSELRDAIAEERTGPIFVVNAPAAIAREAGGDPALALRRSRRGSASTGRTCSSPGAGSARSRTSLDQGRRGRLARESIDAERNAGLGAILVDFAGRVGPRAARAAERSRRRTTGAGPASAACSCSACVRRAAPRCSSAGAGASSATRPSSRRPSATRATTWWRSATTSARSTSTSQMPSIDPQVQGRLRAGRDALHRGRREWERARRPQDLAPVAAALEEGRWAMASAKARMEGKEPPERRAPCFFDPRHGPSSRESSGRRPTASRASCPRARPTPSASSAATTRRRARSSGAAGGCRTGRPGRPTARSPAATSAASAAACCPAF